MEHPMQKLNDLSRSLAPLEPDGTLIAVIELSQSSWLVAGIVPGVERQPLNKLAADEIALLKLLHRWREEAEKAGRRIERTAVVNWIRGAPPELDAVRAARRREDGID
jgi:transposase